MPSEKPSGAVLECLEISASHLLKRDHQVGYHEKKIMPSEGFQKELGVKKRLSKIPFFNTFFLLGTFFCSAMLEK